MASLAHACSPLVHVSHGGFSHTPCQLCFLIASACPGQAARGTSSWTGPATTRPQSGLLLAGWPAVWAALVVCVPPGKLKQCYHIHDACGSEQCVVVTYRRNLLLVRVLWRMLCQVLLRVMHMCYQSRHARPKRGAARRVAYTMRQGGRGHGKAYEKTRRSHNKSRSQGRARREQWARIHEPHAT